jgi:hypothetical protein
MKVPKLRLAAISALVIAGATALWLIQRQSEIKLREEIHSLQTQVDSQLSEKRNADERLSNLLAQASSSLPNDQLRDLLRLRGEVGLLREQTNELLKLQAENRQVQVSPKTQRTPNLAGGELVPVESLTFAGYATPEATLQSTLSAFAKGDLKTFLDGFTPERRQQEEKDFAGKSESEVAATVAKTSADFAASSARILNSKLVADDEAELTVFKTGENQLTTITLHRIAGEWRISKEVH